MVARRIENGAPARVRVPINHGRGAWPKSSCGARQPSKWRIPRATAVTSRGNSSRAGNYGDAAGGTAKLPVMTDFAAAPIPTRTLTLHARKQPLVASSWVAPVVLLDGNRFALGWGTQRYTIPADRPVHIQCEMPFLFTYGRAIAVLEPNQIPELEYSPPASQWFQGEIGAPGTTKTRGTWSIWLALGIPFGILAIAIIAAVAAGLFT